MKRTNRAFTLVEMVLNLTVLMLLSGAITSAVLMASKAIPSSQDPLRNSIAAQEAAERIAADLYTAVAFLEHTANSAEFTVADRNGDYTMETIQYDWSGVAGAALARRYSGGAKRTLVENVHDFQLQYVTATVTEKPSKQMAQSDPVLLASYEGSVDPKDFSITNRNWIGQYFVPTLPVGALDWSVTQVQVKAKSNGSTNGIVSVQLRTPASGNVPSGAIVESHPLHESSLTSSYAWRSISVAGVGGKTPGTGLCLVLAMQQNDTILADVYFDNNGGTGMLTTGNGGSSWSIASKNAMHYRVLGSYTYEYTPPDILHEFLVAVTVTVQVGADPAYRVQTTVQVLNRPELSPLLLLEAI